MDLTKTQILLVFVAQAAWPFIGYLLGGGKPGFAFGIGIMIVAQALMAVDILYDWIQNKTA